MKEHKSIIDARMSVLNGLSTIPMENSICDATCSISNMELRDVTTSQGLTREVQNLMDNAHDHTMLML